MAPPVTGPISFANRGNYCFPNPGLKIILVKQYRYTLKTFTYENPAGLSPESDAKICC